MKTLEQLKIICMGDSITEGLTDKKGIGWVGRLQKSFPVCPPKFFNFGIGGETVAQVYHRMKTECMTRNPDIIMIAVGTNDLSWIRSTQSDAQKMWDVKMIPYIKELKSKNIECIVINLLYNNLYFTSIDDHEKEKKENLELYKSFKDYNQYLAKLTQQNNIDFIDISESWDAKKQGNYYYDKVHPNSKGYDLIAINIYNQLKIILHKMNYEF